MLSQNAYLKKKEKKEKENHFENTVGTHAYNMKLWKNNN